MEFRRLPLVQQSRLRYCTGAVEASIRVFSNHRFPSAGLGLLFYPVQHRRCLRPCHARCFCESRMSGVIPSTSAHVLNGEPMPASGCATAWRSCATGCWCATSRPWRCRTPFKGVIACHVKVHYKRAASGARQAMFTFYDLEDGKVAFEGAREWPVPVSRDVNPQWWRLSMIRW